MLNQLLQRVRQFYDFYSSLSFLLCFHTESNTINKPVVFHLFPTECTKMHQKYYVSSQDACQLWTNFLHFTAIQYVNAKIPWNGHRASWESAIAWKPVHLQQWPHVVLVYWCLIGLNGLHAKLAPFHSWKTISLCLRLISSCHNTHHPISKYSTPH